MGPSGTGKRKKDCNSSEEKEFRKHLRENPGGGLLVIPHWPQKKGDRKGVSLGQPGGRTWKFYPDGAKKTQKSDKNSERRKLTGKGMAWEKSSKGTPNKATQPDRTRGTGKKKGRSSSARRKNDTTGAGEKKKEGDQRTGAKKFRTLKGERKTLGPNKD